MRGQIYWLDFGLEKQKTRLLHASLARSSSTATLQACEADPCPVHDCVLDVDRHHIGSYPNGARLVHKWIHQCTPGTRPACLHHVYFHALKIDVYRM